MDKIFEFLNKIFEILYSHNLDEIEVELKENDKILRIGIKRADSSIQQNLPALEDSTLQKNKELSNLNPAKNLKEKLNEQVEGLIIRAPISGNFYLYPFPGAEPFIREGQPVSKGQIICIIESMKVLNEIESPYNGKVKKILIENSKFVKENEPIIILE